MLLAVELLNRALKRHRGSWQTGDDPHERDQAELADQLRSKACPTT
jgi:hypothetical protein